MQLGNLAFLSGIFSSTSSNHASHMSRLSFVGKARRRLGGWNIRKGMKWGKLHFDLGSFLVAGWRKNDPSDRWVVGFFGKFLDESCFQGGGPPEIEPTSTELRGRMSIWMRPDAIQVTRPRRNSYPLRKPIWQLKIHHLKIYSRIFHCHVSFPEGLNGFQLANSLVISS